MTRLQHRFNTFVVGDYSWRPIVAFTAVSVVAPVKLFL